MLSRKCSLLSSPKLTIQFNLQISMFQIKDVELILVFSVAGCCLTFHWVNFSERVSNIFSFGDINCSASEVYHRKKYYRISLQCKVTDDDVKLGEEELKGPCASSAYSYSSSCCASGWGHGSDRWQFSTPLVPLITSSEREVPTAGRGLFHVVSCPGPSPFCPGPHCSGFRGPPRNQSQLAASRRFSDRKRKQERDIEIQMLCLGGEWVFRSVIILIVRKT